MARYVNLVGQICEYLDQIGNGGLVNTGFIRGVISVILRLWWDVLLIDLICQLVEIFVCRFVGNECGHPPGLINCQQNKNSVSHPALVLMIYLR